jgi:hypothetical protein
MRGWPSSYLVALVTISLLDGGPLCAQDPAEDPRAVAAFWALEQDSIADLGSLLVVDSVRGAYVIALTDRWLQQAEVESRRVIASSLGARLGTVATHLRCPTEPPSPEARAQGTHARCRLVGGVAAAIQISAPRVTDAGFSVEVATWASRPPPPGWDWGGVQWQFRDVLLERQPTGELVVTGMRGRSMALW